MPTSLLDDAEQQEFEAFYEALVAEHFGTTAVPAADLVSFTEQLLSEADAGDVPHRGKMHHIAPLALDPTDPAVIQAAAPRPAREARLLLAGALFGGPLLLGWLLLGLLFPASPSPNRATPTPVPSTTGTEPPSFVTATPLLAPTVAAGFVTVAGQQLPDRRPTTLELAGRSFLVYVAPVKDGNWQVSHDPAVANWLPGAMTNWAFAIFLDSTAAGDPASWLAQLQPGLRMTLRVTSDTHPHQFRLTTRQLIQRTQTEFLDPHQPGLTVAIKIEPDADTRLLIQGREELASAPSPTEVPSGEPATPPETERR